LQRICFHPFSYYCAVFMLLLALGLARGAAAQDKPYFVTYSHDLEDPGDLDVETKTALARPEGGHHYGALATELEYGVRAWWTAELYLDGQATVGDSAVYTGFRIENRFRPLKKEYVVNPVLYVEYENISGADKTILEIVGHDGEPDLVLPNAVTKLQHQHEGEFKLILSSDVRGWNISENFISEKNLGHAPWEFGYALGIARPLRANINDRECTFCAEKVIAGIEAYGGLGDTWSLSLSNTSHYVAPVVGWELPGHWRVSLSPGFGVTGSSLDQFYRIGVVREFDGIGKKFRGGDARVW
jgi:hypothetical protein